MTVRDILVCLDSSGASEVRLGLALGLAQTHRARLAGAYVMPPPFGNEAAPGMGILPTVLGPSSPVGAAVAGGEAVPEGPASRVRRAAEQADIAEQRVREELKLRGLDGDWHLVDEDDRRLLVTLAQAADLIVIGQRAAEDGFAQFSPEPVIVESGRPVLVVPYAGHHPQIGQRVLAAWDGTREANRALHDALPVLAPVAAVSVTLVADDEPALERTQSPIAAIVAHLRRHGVNAVADQTPRGGMPVAEVLLSRAADFGADLIVAGAYHHSQLREALLGGVSRDLLDHMTVPVLMSH